MPELTPNLLLNAYAQGYFPMADDQGELWWLCPNPRAIFELDDFHIPRTLRQLYRQQRFELTLDRAFREVIAACADRVEGTWISREIHDAFVELHEAGFAHSIEVWQQGELAGGLYGLALGGAFFGESMFNRVPNASKIALVYLVERLRACGFVLLDTQFTTEHLDQFKPKEIPRKVYLRRLDEALQKECTLGS
jgi:leucyl/phenylalanyl-tRNA--protein transferase